MRTPCTPGCRKLHAAFAKVIAMPEIKDRILSQSNEVGGGPAADFAAFIQSESGKWSKLLKDRNIKIE